MKRLFKDIGIYGLGNIFNKGVNLLLLPLFTAYLTPVDYGIQSLLSFMMLLLIPFTNLGIGTSFGICYVDKEIEQAKAKTVWTSFFLLLGVSVFFAALTITFSKPLSGLLFSNSGYSYLLVLTALTFIFNTLLFPFNAYLQFESRALTFVLISCGSAIFNVVINCYLVMRLSWGIDGLVWGGLWANLLQFTLLYLAIFKKVPVKLSKRVLQSLLQHGIPMISGFFFLFFIQNSWRYILEHFTSMAALGIFSVGYNIGCVSLLFVSSLISSWAPYFLRFAEKQEETREHFSKIYSYYYFFAGSLALCFFLYSKLVVELFTAQPFHSCWIVVGWIALGHLASGGYYLYLPGVYFAKNVKLVNISLLTSTCVTVAVTALATLYFGMLGTAIAFFIGQFSLSFAQQMVNGYWSLYTVPHESPRLVKFICLLSVGITYSYIPRNFVFIEEFLFATFYLAIHLLLTCKLLDAEEKGRLFKFVGLSRRARGY